MSQNICRKADFLECHIAVMLWKIFLPIFLAIGVPGNILSLLVLSRRRMRHTTTSIYLRLLSIVDTTALLISIPRQILYFYAEVDVLRLNSFSCKIYSFLNPCIIFMSWCLLPIITVDRLIQVRYPIWAKENCTKKSAIIVFCALSLVAFALNFHSLAFLTATETPISPNSTTVKVTCGPAFTWYEDFKNKIWPMIVTVLFSIIPVVFQIVCNILLVRELTIRTRQNKAKRTSHKREEKDLKSVTRMLTVVCLFFIVSSLPQCTYIILKPYIFNTGDPEDFAKGLLCKTFVQLFMYSNNCINFLLYAVSGRVFQKELRSMFEPARRPIMKWMGRSVHPMETTCDQGSQGQTSKGRTEQSKC